MVAPIQSIKHYVPQTSFGLNSGLISNIDLVESVVAPATANANQVQEGATVKAVYCELWITSKAATTDESTFIVAIEKLPSAGPDMTFTNITNLGAYLNKKNILYTTQGIIPASLDGGPTIPVVRSFILIPKGKQRMGLGDKFIINVGAVGNIRICGIFTYKEYR